MSDEGVGKVSDANAARAGGISAKALWEQAPTLITLIGLLSYGLGRLAVDGFYGQLHTTAEAAGLGYASILEPTALLAAIIAGVGTAIVMIWYELLLVAWWLIRHGHMILLLLGIVALLAGLAYVVTLVRIDDVLAFAAGIAAPALRELAAKFRGVRDRLGWQASARQGQPLPGLEPHVRRAMLRRVASVTVSLAVLTAAFLGADEFGTHEGRQAASGNPVSISLLGFTIPSITATAVRVQPITRGSVLGEELGEARCWLQVGPGSSRVVLYNPVDKETLTVPADQILMRSINGGCR